MNRKIADMKLSLILTALLAYGLDESFAILRSVALAVEPTEAAVRSAEEIANQLDSLVLDVNGERKRVEAGSSVDVVFGDLLTIVEASLADKSAPVEVVDLVGFKSTKSKHSRDDRGWVIDTGRHLSKKRSVTGDGKQYKIQVSGRRGLSGEVMLNVLDPELVSISLEVNGSIRKVHPGDVLRLSAKDMIRVVEVRTNVRGNENVKYDQIAKKGHKELRFSRGGRIFARIPIEWLSQ